MIFNKIKLKASTDRVLWIDAYKGIAILLVILGHLDITSSLYRFIYMFHMYAFFFIAGVTFTNCQEDLFNSFFRKNIIRLYLPYLIFAILWDFTNIIVKIFHGLDCKLSLKVIISHIFYIGIGGGFESSASIGPAWFLLCLLTSRIIYWLLVRLLKHIYLIGLTSLLLFILGHILNDFQKLPFFLVQSLTVYIFIFFGYSTKSFIKSTIYNISDVLVFGISLLVCLFISTNIKSDLILMNNHIPKNLLMVLIGGLSGCIMLKYLSIIICKIPKAANFFIYFGINSMIIMGTHSEIRVALNFLLNPLNINSILLVLIKFILTLIISIPVIYFMNHYTPFLLGKQKCNK